MTNREARRSFVSGIAVKIGFPLLIGLFTLAAADASGLRGWNCLALTAVITLGVALVFFMVDTEVRIAAVDERIAKGFTEIDRSAGLSALMEGSILDTALLVDFVETAGRADGRVNPLLQRLARREIERMTSFVRQLPVGSEIAYDGEDRDWLLGLTREAESSMDALSLSTVDAGVQGLDGGLWTGDLGHRYLELQREAIVRNVRIRRIFVVEDAKMARDESFRKVTEMQRAVGVEVRMLDHQLIPDWMQSMISDFIVFDGTVSYETTSATAFPVAQTSPGMLQVRLVPMPEHVHAVARQFELLWAFADPDRQIDG